MPYEVNLSPGARRAFVKLGDSVRARIEQRIDDLAANPRPPGCVKLGGFANTWRVRVGEYRIVYEVYDNRLVVVVIRIGHRREVYEGG